MNAVETDPVLEEGSRLAERLAAGWRRGLCCRAEELFAEYPAVGAHAQAAVRVIYEEVCQRQEAGQEVSLAELGARFPQWRDELAVVLDCHRVLGLTSATRFPVVGEALAEFRLLAELGRGGRGRVYLAEQSSLSDRLMVVKVTPCGGQEHLKLARLQHTHIVPLYSTREIADRNLLELCMPCLGGATLQQVLVHLAATPPERRTGRDLLEAVRAAVADPRLSWPPRGPNGRFLERAGYTEAVCWIGVCLADATKTNCSPCPPCGPSRQGVARPGSSATTTWTGPARRPCGATCSTWPCSGVTAGCGWRGRRSGTRPAGPPCGC